MIKQLLGLGLGAVIGGSVVAGTLGNQMDSLKQENTEIRLELDTEKDKSSKLQLSLEEALADVSYNQTLVTQLTSDLETKTTALNTALAEKENISAELAEVELALETSQGNLTELQARYDELSSNYQTSQATITTLQSENVDLQAQITELNAEIERLNEIIAEYESQQNTVTPASYFNFSQGTITGLSTEGQALYDNGELTEISIPASYSIDPDSIVEQTHSFDDFSSFVTFCDENTVIYPITVTDSSGSEESKIIISSQEEIDSNCDILMNYFGILATITTGSIIDGNETSVVSIGSGAFHYNDKLTSITIPETITNIGDNAFGYCKALVNIVIPNSVINIKNSAFEFCTSLTNITLSSNVTSLGKSTFRGCQSLTSITIPKSVTSIGDEAFWSCKNLTSIVVEEGNTVYDSRNNCNAILETSTNKLIAGCSTTVIPVGVASIGANAFYECENLTSIIIPGSVTNIGEDAFFRCYGLTHVTLSEGITNIETFAFRNCTGLTSLTIPNSVTSIGDKVFLGCENLTSITLLPTTPPTITIYTFSSSSIKTIYVPFACSLVYLDADNWNALDVEYIELDIELEEE